MENKIALLTGDIGPSGGGVYYAVHGLAQSLKGNDVSIIGVSEKTSANQPNDKIKRITYKPIFSKKLAFGKGLIKAIKKQYSVIHIHGIWSLQPIICHLFSRKTPIIISPHGMLAEWVMSKNKLFKKFFFRFFLAPALNNAKCIHALTENESKQIRSILPNCKVAVIPNPMETYSLSTKPLEKKINIIYIGRYHPMKGLSELIDASTHLKNSSTRYSIELFGWGDEKYKEELRRKIISLGVGNIVSLNGPIYDKEKFEKIVNSDAFILPSYHEGLPMSVLEAWACSRPALITPNCNLHQGVTENAALEISAVTSKDIAETIINFAQLSPSQVEAMQRSAQKLLESKFSYEQVSKSFDALYKYASGNAQQPDFVK